MTATCSWSGSVVEGAHIETSGGNLFCPQCGASVRPRKKRGAPVYVYPAHEVESPEPRADLLAMREESLAERRQQANAARWAWLEDHWLDTIDGMRVIEYMRHHTLRHGGLAECVDYLMTLQAPK